MGARGIVALAVRSGLVRGDERVGESLEPFRRRGRHVGARTRVSV